MGFRKTHRRTKKRGGTRQRGGAEAAPATKAQLEQALVDTKEAFDGLTPEEKKDLSNQVVINLMEANKKANNYNITPDAGGNAPTEKIDLSSARTGLPENLVQALDAEARAADDATKVANTEGQPFDGEEKNKFIANLTGIFTKIFTEGAEDGADLSVVVKNAFETFNTGDNMVDNNQLATCFTPSRGEVSVNLDVAKFVEILQKDREEENSFFFNLKTKDYPIAMGGGGKRRKTRRRRRRHGKKKAKKTHHKKKRKSRRKKRNTRRKRH